MKNEKMWKWKLGISGVLCAAMLGVATQGAAVVFAEETAAEETAAEAVTVQGTAVSDLNVETASESIQGSIHVEKLSSGAIAYVYVPDNEMYGVRATASPILTVFGNAAYTAQSALETAYSSGLAAIADLEQTAVVFINPIGETWAEDDKASLEAAKNLFSDSTDNAEKGSDYVIYGKNESAAYAGSYCRVYVFGEGTGADFVYEQLSAGVDGAGQFLGNALIKPTAAFLMNPSSENSVDLTASDGREIPVVIVNGTDTVKSAYETLNATTETSCVESDVTEGFDAQAVTAAYDEVMEHYMVRVQSSVGKEDCITTLLKISGNTELGLTETKNDYEFEDGTVLTYYEWSDGNDGEPLLVTMHGSGSSAENLVWTAGLNDLAASEGFHLVSFENYSNENLDNEKLMEAIDQIAADANCDTSRIYVSGFSMGSMRSWKLALEYSEKFAGVIGMSAFPYDLDGSEEFANEMPAYAIAGKESYIAALEFPSAESCILETALLKANHVAEDFTFDESAGVWGLTPTETYTITAEDLPELDIEVSTFADADGNVLTAFASASCAGHEPMRAAAADAWAFISKFSRNADGTISEAE